MITTTTTVSTATPPAGSNVAVSFPYRFDEEEHLAAWRVSSTGVRTLLVEGTDYSVSGTGNQAGGTLILTTVATGDTIVVSREVDITQQLDLVSNDRFPAGSLEAQMDKQIQIDQQLQGGLNRAIKVHPGEPNPVVGARASRSDKFLAYDSNGDYAEYNGAQVWAKLPVPPGTVSGLGTKYFADDAHRNATVPDAIGQLGIQIDTGTPYRATALTAGAWAELLSGPVTIPYNATAGASGIPDAVTADVDTWLASNPKPNGTLLRFLKPTTGSPARFSTHGAVGTAHDPAANGPIQAWWVSGNAAIPAGLIPGSDPAWQFENWQATTIKLGDPALKSDWSPTITAAIESLLYHSQSKAGGGTAPSYSGTLIFSDATGNLNNQASNTSPSYTISLPIPLYKFAVYRGETDGTRATIRPAATWLGEGVDGAGTDKYMMQPPYHESGTGTRWSMVIKDLAIYCVNDPFSVPGPGNDGVNGIYWEGSITSMIKRVKIRQALTYGLTVSNYSDTTLIEQVICEGRKGTYLTPVAFNINGAETTTLINCESQACDVGIKAQLCGPLKVINHETESVGTPYDIINVESVDIDGNVQAFRNVNGIRGSANTYPYKTISGITSDTGSFTVDATTDVITSTSHGLNDGDQIYFRMDSGSGTLPGGLNTSPYWVINSTAHTFQVETSLGGGVYDITAAAASAPNWSWWKPAVFTTSANHGLSVGDGVFFPTGTFTYVDRGSTLQRYVTLAPAVVDINRGIYVYKVLSPTTFWASVSPRVEYEDPVQVTSVGAGITMGRQYNAVARIVIAPDDGAPPYSYTRRHVKISGNRDFDGSSSKWTTGVLVCRTSNTTDSGIDREQFKTFENPFRSFDFRLYDHPQHNLPTFGTNDDAVVGDGKILSTYSFADAAARAAAVPSAVGLLGVQRDDGTVWRSSGTSAGDWLASALTPSITKGASGPDRWTLNIPAMTNQPRIDLQLDTAAWGVSLDPIYRIVGGYVGQTVEISLSSGSTLSAVFSDTASGNLLRLGGDKTLDSIWDSIVLKKTVRNSSTLWVCMSFQSNA